MARYVDIFFQGDQVAIASDFDQYLKHLSNALGHADRRTGLRDYCTALMLPLSRKSIEPMAARVDPLHASAKHQALHHFVAKASWSRHSYVDQNPRRWL
jgi:SRSO17 transposase